MNKFTTSWILPFLLLVLGGVGYSTSMLQDSPRVIRAVAPTDYPPYAAAAMVQGKVTVEVMIDMNGDVMSTNIVEGQKLLQDASRAAASRWKFAKSEERKSRSAQLTFTFVHWTQRKQEELGTTTFIPPYEVETVGRAATIQREVVQ